MKLVMLQKEIAEFNEENDLNLDPKIRLLDLYSELGEVAKEILKGSDYGKREMSLGDEWDDEIGDCLYSLISLANETGVDLEASLKEVKQKYQYRIDDKGQAGSGN